MFYFVKSQAFFVLFLYLLCGFKLFICAYCTYVVTPLFSDCPVYIKCFDNKILRPFLCQKFYSHNAKTEPFGSVSLATIWQHINSRQMPYLQAFCKHKAQKTLNIQRFWAYCITRTRFFSPKLKQICLSFISFPISIISFSYCALTC